MDFDHTQQEEAATWLIEDPVKRYEKAQREFIRYPMIKKQMGLSYLDTSNMVIWDIGAGPLDGVSALLPSRQTVRIDPLADQYKKYFACHGYKNTKAEDLKEQLGVPDLIIVTNALDHFDNPTGFLSDLNQYMKYGAYFASLHAIDNAITHPHPAHVHNLTPDLFRKTLTRFEVVWELNYYEDHLTYGWRKQPAFSFLMRKTI